MPTRMFRMFRMLTLAAQFGTPEMKRSNVQAFLVVWCRRSWGIIEKKIPASWGNITEFWLVPSGKRLHNYQTSPLGKSTISMAIFNSYVTNYQWVNTIHWTKWALMSHSSWGHERSTHVNRPYWGASEARKSTKEVKNTLWIWKF